MEPPAAWQVQVIVTWILQSQHPFSNIPCRSSDEDVFFLKYGAFFCCHCFMTIIEEYQKNKSLTKAACFCGEIASSIYQQQPEHPATQTDAGDHANPALETATGTRRDTNGRRRHRQQTGCLSAAPATQIYLQMQRCDGDRRCSLTLLGDM